MFKFLIILILVLLQFGLQFHQIEVECSALRQLIDKSYLNQHLEINQLRTKLNLSPNQVVLIRDELLNNYYAYFYIGTPRQPIKLSFDARLSYTWILSSKCVDIGSEFHELHYNSSKSTTYKANGKKVDFTWNYHNLSSELSVDDFHFGGGLKLKQYTFCESLHVDFDLLENRSKDGMIGLGFNDQQETFVESLYRQKLIEKPVISFYYARDSHSLSTFGGIVTFGGVDQNYFLGDITYVPAITTTTNQSIEGWKFMIDGMHVVFEGQTVASICSDHNHNCSVSLDTSDGVSFLGPADLVTTLNTNLGAHWHPWGFWEISCSLDELADVELTIGNRNFTITPGQYVIQVSGACASAFQPLSADGEELDTDWIISWSVMVEFYTVFDYEKKQIGFAETLY